MISRSFLALISAVLVVFMMTTMSTEATSAVQQSPYLGTWHLDALYDESEAPVTVPGDFKMAFLSYDDDYQISIHIGNTLNARVKVTDPTSTSTAIEIAFVRSTMMMPPQELFTLEMFLTDAIPKMVSMTLEEPVLTMQGTAAKIVFTRVEE